MTTERVRKLPKKPVYCPNCRRFLFNIVITVARPEIGAIGAITDFHCQKCKRSFEVLFGAADRDIRSNAEKVEGQIRKAIAEENNGGQ